MNLSKTFCLTESKEVWVRALVPPLTEGLRSQMQIRAQAWARTLTRGGRRAI